MPVYRRVIRLCRLATTVKTSLNPEMSEVRRKEVLAHLASIYRRIIYSLTLIRDNQT